VMKVHWFGRALTERAEYAGKEEFVRLFERERTNLQRLALLLTADSEAAKQCLLRAYQECIANSSVSNEWILIWARRVVVRHAIRIVLDIDGQSSSTPNDNTNNGSIVFIADVSPHDSLEVESIVHLPQLDRLVFVLCTLEHYSNHDCALLLGRSLREISDARQRVETSAREMSG
jgi:DNA-directed RNA polymerase specialized sigma24 family protein